MRFIEIINRKKFTLISIFLCFYATLNLFDGERGLISYFEKQKIKEQLLQEQKLLTVRINSVEKKNSLLFKNIDDKEMLFYFVHSYYFNLDQQEDCSSSIYYEKKITASVEKDNIFGVQFHPEKSQAGGLKILKNFCNL